MKLRNKFEIFSNGVVASAHNSVTHLGEHLANNLAYARYIVVEGSGGRIVRETSLVKMAKSAPFTASYQIELLSNEYDGFVIEKIGFSPFEDGHEMANIATFDGVTKEFGSSLIILATLYLDLSHSGVSILGEDNPFIPYFLGACPLADESFYAMPYSEKKPPLALDENKCLLTLEKKQSGLSLVGNVISGEDGVCIFMGNTPVFRVFSFAYEAVRSVDIDTSLGEITVLGDKNASLFNATIDGLPVFQGYAANDIVGRGEIHSSGIKTAQNGYLLAAPGGNYFASVSKNDVTIFDAESLEVIRIIKNQLANFMAFDYLAPPNKRRIMLCNDGSVAFFGDRLTLERTDGAKKEYNIFCHSQGAISCCENGYYVVTDSLDYITRYHIDTATDNVSIVGISQKSGDFCIFRAGRGIAVINGTTVEVRDNKQKIIHAEDNLSKIVSQNKGLKITANENIICVHTSASFIHYTHLDYDYTITAMPTCFFGDGLFANTAALEYVRIFKPPTSLYKIDTGEMFTSAIKIRNKIVIVGENGIIKSIPFVLGDLHFYHPPTQKKVSCTVSKKILKQLEKVSLNMDFC